MSKHKIILSGLFFLIFVSTSCSSKIPVIKPSDISEVDKQSWDNYYNSIPVLKPITMNKVHQIKVKRIHDSRLKDFSDEQYRQLYKQIENDVMYYLNYQIKINDTGNEEIVHFFKKYSKTFLKPQYKYLIGAHVLDPESPKDSERLKKTIATALENKPWDIIKKYVDAGAITSKNIPLLTDYFYERFLVKHREIGNIPVNYGKGVLREGDYGLTQHYNYWTSILNETREADFFITNSIMAGVDDQMPLYVINRGGITSGVTENNINNPYQGTILLTLLPFISESEFFNRERGTIPENILIQTISMMAVHEFGHYLRRFAENYGLPVTPQNAPVDLRYQDWYFNIINGKNMASNLKFLDKY